MALETPHPVEIEFMRLSPEAQLDLLNRLNHRLRSGMTGEQDAWEAQLSVMATDPQVQAELRRIEDEFAGAEADGLAER